ncbi:hypothetical protein IV102_02740 [bacterium]|nr:hypothetical protein [bacterium]
MIGIPTTPETVPTVRSIWNDCLGYWEPRRIGYNLVLTVVVVAQLTSLQAWPQMATLKAVVGMVVCCALANFCYCSAYVIDLGLQHSDYREGWLQRRGGLFFAGCILGCALTALCVPLVLIGLQ